MFLCIGYNRIALCFYKLLDTLYYLFIFQSLYIHAQFIERISSGTKGSIEVEYLNIVRYTQFTLELFKSSNFYIVSNRRSAF